MRPVFQTTVGLLVLSLSACELKVRQAETPPAPHPTVAKSEPPPAPIPAEPLSIPQTQVRLPQPQPIDPEAIATPPIPVEAAAHPKTRKRPGPQPATASSVKPEPVETADAPATEPPPRRMEPVLSDEQRRQRLEEISARLKEVEQILTRVSARPLGDPQKRPVEQIRKLAAQAYAAKDQGDIQMAAGLADRALIQAQDLDRAR